MKQLEADYLVIGSGAVGMSFVDVLLEESDATVIIVDNHHQPGGHWNDAYPFVRLHQPSHFYGVTSTPLGSFRRDLSLIHISEPTRRTPISYAVFCLKK